MRQLLLLIIFLSAQFINAQQEAPSYPWKSIGQLEWEDYKAKPNKASSFKALTATGVSFAINYEESILTINIINSFDPSDSWTKDKSSTRLLAHERLHFDISELFARKLRKAILETTFTSRGKALMNEISGLYQKKMKELAHFQKAYDKETDHSIIEKTQKEWELMVHHELESLNNYASSEIQVNLED